MFQIFGILAILVVATWMLAEAHGADMAQRMIEQSGWLVVLKYPLAWASVLGGIIGSAIASHFQRKDKLPKFLIGCATGIPLSPTFFTFTDIVPTISTALACGLVYGLVAWMFLELLFDREIRTAIKHGVIRRIDQFGGRNSERRGE